MFTPLDSTETFGFVRPTVDAHTLGISYVSKLLLNSGYGVEIAGVLIADAINQIRNPSSIILLRDWIHSNRITRLGLSYRLDPEQATFVFGCLYHQLASNRLLGTNKYQIRTLYFAGLPAACETIQKEYGGNVPVFCGDETPHETLTKLGVPSHRIPITITKQSEYDNSLMNFGRTLVEDGAYTKILPEDRSGYPEFGTHTDHLIKRIDYAKSKRQSPLMRVHVGPYQPDRILAIEQFIGWLHELAGARLLDIVSIGTSQLTQERFAQKWGDLPNGGGVPIQTESEYVRIWEAARPMLVRTYAGTSQISRLARIHEKTLNIAWHALSFWWFSRIDGRGPNSVYDNLKDHFDTLDYIASTAKPFEPNIPHHFSFRGGDDVTYVLSAYLAAKAAKLKGVRYFVLQNMLNTPKYTLGIQDLAKSRALLMLVKELQDEDFRVIYQPRAGLDLFSPDIQKAKAQLAAVSALMDDVEPDSASSPDVIHVVSFSEASHLADPMVINESIQIVREALRSYRHLRNSGQVPNTASDPEVIYRTQKIISDVRDVVRCIEQSIPNPYTPEGLYCVFAAGFLVAPYLWECRDEFSNAVSWTTDIVDGGVAVVDQNGNPITALDRANHASANLSNLVLPFKLSR